MNQGMQGRGQAMSRGRGEEGCIAHYGMKGVSAGWVAHFSRRRRPDQEEEEEEEKACTICWPDCWPLPPPQRPQVEAQ